MPRRNDVIVDERGRLGWCLGYCGLCKVEFNIEAFVIVFNDIIKMAEVEELGRNEFEVIGRL